METDTKPSQWTEIASRQYPLDSAAMIPEWRDQMLIGKYMYMAKRNLGWIARKREVKGGFVKETVVWKERPTPWSSKQIASLKR